MIYSGKMPHITASWSVYPLNQCMLEYVLGLKNNDVKTREAVGSKGPRYINVSPPDNNAHAEEPCLRSQAGWARW